MSNPPEGIRPRPFVRPPLSSAGLSGSSLPVRPPMNTTFRPRPPSSAAGAIGTIPQNQSFASFASSHSSASFGGGGAGQQQSAVGNIRPAVSAVTRPGPMVRPAFTPRPSSSSMMGRPGLPANNSSASIINQQSPQAPATTSSAPSFHQFQQRPQIRPSVSTATSHQSFSQFNPVARPPVAAGNQLGQIPQQSSQYIQQQQQVGPMSPPAPSSGSASLAQPSSQPSFQPTRQASVNQMSSPQANDSVGKPGRRTYPSMQHQQPAPPSTNVGSFHDQHQNFHQNASSVDLSNGAPFPAPGKQNPLFQQAAQQYGNQQAPIPSAPHQNNQFQPQHSQLSQHPDGYQPVPISNPNHMQLPNPNISAPQPYANGAPAYGAAPVAQLGNNFQNMQINGSIQPVGINLFANPPPISYFSAPAPVPDILQQAATNSPKSNSGPEYKRCTLNKIPQTAALLGKSALPFGILITPFRQLLDNEEPVPVVQAPQIVRCRRCRTYINPWVQFIEQGTRWKCNMCFLPNDVPTFFDWDPENRNRLDRLKRAELTHGVVEFVAPQEYMVRPPQPVVIVFVIDVSYGAVQSGMVATAAKVILDSLDGIPNADDRTKIGFITFDSSLHFYNLSASSSEPHMLIVSDLEQPYLPIPYDLLVSLTESRSVIESFLLKLPQLFGSTQQTLSAMGKALKSAEKMIGSIGGKIICLQHSLPNHEDGSLKLREDSKLLGTPKETVLLQPATSFYKSFAVDCSPSQISIDVFLFNAQYADVATLSSCAKFTGGCLYYYQGFSAARSEDATKFGHELSHLLSRPLGLEAVLRIRASKGIKMSTFHGNFFLRSTDLLSLPNVNPDNSYTIELSITEDLLKTSSACFQTALLYTSSNGERRIRVLTLSVPVSSSLSEVYMGADQRAIVAFLVKKAIDRSLTSKIEDARDALIYKLSEILSVYKSSFNQATHPQQLMIAENMQLLPVFTLAMIKNLFLREGNTIPSDVRSFMLSWQYATSPEIALLNLYPRFWSLESLFADPSIGMPDQTSAILYPDLLNLSSEKLNRGNMFLLDNGLEIFLWIGRQVSPEMLMSIFGQPNQDSIPVGKTALPPLDNDFSRRLRNVIDDIRACRMKLATIYPHLYIAREDGDPSLRMWFLSHFVEDRIGNNLSYPQFLASVREKVQKMKA